MRALALVLVFWLFVGIVVGVSLGIAATAAAGWYLLTGVLAAIPVLGLSIFLWYAFRDLV